MNDFIKILIISVFSPHLGTGETPCCDGRPYNASSQQCCVDVIHETNGTSRCCGRDSIDPRSSICCLGRTLPRIDENTQCCGAEPYDASKNTCCRGKLTAMVGDHVECCGSEGFNTATHACCDYRNGGIVEKNTTENLTSCCDGVLFNPSKNICCHGKLSLLQAGDDPSKSLCCGQEAFNPSSSFCCGSTKVVPGFPMAEYDCCKGKMFSLKSEMCCNERVFPRAGPDMACCQDEVYNVTSQLCCQRPVQNDAEVGMEGRVYQKQGENRCCGIQGYDRSSQMCCKEEKEYVVKSRSSGQQCCASGGVA